MALKYDTIAGKWRFCTLILGQFVDEGETKELEEREKRLQLRAVIVLVFVSSRSARNHIVYLSGNKIFATIWYTCSQRFCIEVMAHSVSHGQWGMRGLKCGLFKGESTHYLSHVFSRSLLAVTPARVALFAGSHSALCTMDYPSRGTLECEARFQLGWYAGPGI